MVPTPQKPPPSASFVLRKRGSQGKLDATIATSGQPGSSTARPSLGQGVTRLGDGIAHGAQTLTEGLFTGAAHGASTGVRAGVHAGREVGGLVVSSAELVGSGLSKGAHSIGGGFNAAKQKLENSVDSIIEDRVDWILRLVGARVSNMLVDDFMPAKLRSAIKRVWDSFWPDIAANVRDDVMSANGLGGQRSKRLLISLDAWPPPPPLWPPSIHATRAFVLYAVFPADVSFWQLVRKPAMYPVLALLFFPFASVSTLTWVCLLLIIDHNDEYQLANYILVFRAALFVSVGLYWSIKGFVQLYLCTTEKGGDCLLTGPGVTDYQTYKITMTLARLVCGWIAFVLLTRLRLSQEKSLPNTLGEIRLNSGDKQKKFKRTDRAQRGVTRYEVWAAAGCAIGIVGGFVIGLAGTVLLYFEVSFDGREHTATLVNFQNTLLPFSLLPSVNAILGAAAGCFGALFKELVQERKRRKRMLKQLAKEEQRRNEQVEKRLIPDLIPKLRGRSTTPSEQPHGLSRYEKTLWRAFNATDVDHSGHLERIELMHALDLCGIKATDEEVFCVMDRYDWDKSGALEWREFRVLGNDLRGHVRVAAVNPMTKLLLYEATAFSSTVLFVILNGYLYIGPQVFWDTSPNFFWYTINILLYGPEDPTVRMTLFFGLAVGSLISFLPFLVFKFPLLGPALLQLKATGYDQAGNVRPVLTRVQKAAKAEAERRERQKQRRDTPKESIKKAKAGSPSQSAPNSGKNGSSNVRSRVQKNMH